MLNNAKEPIQKENCDPGTGEMVSITIHIIKKETEDCKKALEAELNTIVQKTQMTIGMGHYGDKQFYFHF